MQKNEDLRQEAKKSGIKLWRIAAKYGLTDGNFSRKLRKEMSPEDKARVLRIIEELRKEEEGQYGQENLSERGN